MTQTMLPNLAARILGTPLMVDRARLEIILSVIGHRIGIDPTGMPPGFEDDANSSRTIITPNGIAIVPIHGTLVKRAGAIEAASGLLPYAVVEEMILDAATDPAVKAILMDIDSPGGEVGGVFDLATLIREAGEEKPVWALADDAFSAAYLIASAAHRIILPQTAGIGSVGVIAVHVDESQRDAKEGRQYTTVYAGANKNDFSSHAPLSDDAQARLQKEVDRLYGMFVGAVVQRRNMTEAAVRATEAGLFFGADAVTAGLADQVGTIRDVLADLTAKIETPRKTIFHRAAQPPDPPHREINMPMNDKQAADKPVATSPEPTTETPHPATAETIDLDKVRAEKEAQLRGEAQAIVDLCTLADMPDLAGGFIAKGMDAQAVRKELLTRRASGPEVQSHVMPGDGTRIKPQANLNANPVMTACKRMAEQHATGA